MHVDVLDGHARHSPMATNLEPVLQPSVDPCEAWWAELFSDRARGVRGGQAGTFWCDAGPTSLPAPSGSR
jgi:hypothetical protein